MKWAFMGRHNRRKLDEKRVSKMTLSLADQENFPRRDQSPPFKVKITLDGHISLNSIGYETEDFKLMRFFARRSVLYDGQFRVVQNPRKCRIVLNCERSEQKKIEIKDCLEKNS